MVFYCSVRGCINENVTNKNKSFFAPSKSKPHIYKKWVEFAQMPNSRKTVRICSDHFELSSYKKITPPRPLLKPDAVPTIPVRQKIGAGYKIFIHDNKKEVKSHLPELEDNAAVPNLTHIDSFTGSITEMPIKVNEVNVLNFTSTTQNDNDYDINNSIMDGVTFVEKVLTKNTNPTESSSSFIATLQTDKQNNMLVEDNEIRISKPIKKSYVPKHFQFSSKTDNKLDANIEKSLVEFEKTSSSTLSTDLTNNNISTNENEMRMEQTSINNNDLEKHINSSPKSAINKCNSNANPPMDATTIKNILLEEKIASKNLKIRNLRKQIAALRSKIYRVTKNKRDPIKRKTTYNIESIIEATSNLMTKEAHVIFSAQLRSSLLSNKKNASRYSDELKDIALRLRHISSNAYDFLKKIFYLPNKRTLSDYQRDLLTLLKD